MHALLTIYLTMLPILAVATFCLTSPGEFRQRCLASALVAVTWPLSFPPVLIFSLLTHKPS